VVALLAATAAAFALTQGLKSQPSPIFGTEPGDVFSPVCGCKTRTATIAFKLREDDELDVAIVKGGEVVRTLERGRPFDRGPVEIVWDGRDDAGRLLPEGEYLPRVHSRSERWTITLPNPNRIDVTPPRLELRAAEPRVFSPDGDGRRDRVTFRYELSEPGRAMLLIDGKRRVLTNFPRTDDKFEWSGKVGGRALPPATYTARLAAVDPAGNVGARSRPFAIVIRYVVLGRDRISVAAGAQFAVRVSADAKLVRWALGGRGGVARPGTLRLSAPLQKGRFTLSVRANGHTARAAVFVREPRP
jgi:hypothetical protein